MNANEAVEDLKYIQNEIGEHVHNALRIIRGVEPGVHERARRYWGAHILGALDNDGEFGRGSMVTMQDTIDELLGKSDEELEHERVESMAKRLVRRLTEGEGTPGFDVPDEESREVKLAKDILSSLDDLQKDILASRDDLQMLGYPLDHPCTQRRLDKIRKAAEQLIDMHK